MPRDKTRIALNALIGLIIVTAVSTLAYRYYYYGGDDEITKFLCEDFPVVTGKCPLISANEQLSCSEMTGFLV
jgi:hypothetical protein